MRIIYMSDLHLEFDSDFLPTNDTGADTLILAGDIFVAADLQRAEVSSKYWIKEKIINFLLTACKRFKHVIYIMGNHEHYHGAFNTTANIIRQTMSGVMNFHFLDKKHIIIDDILFYGATMWTDFMGGNPVAMKTAEFTMNDYKCVKAHNKDYRKLSAMAILEEHFKARNELLNVLSRHKLAKTVVITHHAPSNKSIHPRYSNDTMTNSFYNSDLSNIMLDNPQINSWIHGHTHDSFSYTVGNTTVRCNPKGYYDENRGFNQEMYFDV